MIYCVSEEASCELNIFVLQQQQNIGQIFGTDEMHLSPPLPQVA